MSHSKFSPSGYSRWSKCPGSLALIEKNPHLVPTSSKFAEEGTRVHNLASEYLEHGTTYLDSLNEEDATFLDTYTEFCDSEFGSVKQDTRRFVEQKVAIPDTGVYGTADCIIWNATKKDLHVIDLKWGTGVVVEVVDNAQLKIYALAAILTLDLEPMTVRCTIVQPRAPHADGPIRTVEFGAVEMLDFQNELLAAVDACTEDAPTIPGDHCRWCPMAGICPSLKEKAVATAKKVFAPATSYDVKELARTLDNLDAVKTWLEATKSFAMSELSRGVQIPGYKLVASRATRKWRNEAVTRQVLSTEFHLNADQINETSLRSPAQIEKQMPKGASRTEAFMALITQESTGVTIAPENDNRAAVTASLAHNIFTAIE